MLRKRQNPQEGTTEIELLQPEKEGLDLNPSNPKKIRLGEKFNDASEFFELNF